MKHKCFYNMKTVTKLTLSYSVAFLLIVIISTVISFIMLFSFVHSEIESQLDEAERWIDSHVDKNKLYVLDDFSNETSPFKDSIYIKLVTEAGDIDFQSNEFDFNFLEGKPQEKPLYNKYKQSYIAYTVKEKTIEGHGKSHFVIVKSFEGFIVLFIEILLIEIGINLMCYLLFITISYRLIKASFNPVEEIIQFTEKINENLDERLPDNHVNREMKVLFDSINLLLDSVQFSVDKQVQFVADASHELKTPITAILGYINLIERWGINKRDVLETSVSAIKRESNSMKHLIDKLLFLAKCDNNVNVLDKSVFCINDIIGEVLEEARLIYKNHVFTTAKTDTAFIECDYHFIKQLLHIFVENSAKYTEAQPTRIDISSILLGGTIKIIVSDNGYGIPEHELGLLFNRFYCSEKSRGKPKSGNGLGLSIAKKIVELHNGTIQIDSKLGIGTVVTVCFSIST